MIRAGLLSLAFILASSSTSTAADCPATLRHPDALEAVERLTLKPNATTDLPLDHALDILRKRLFFELSVVAQKEATKQRQPTGPAVEAAFALIQRVDAGLARVCYPEYVAAHETAFARTAEARREHEEGVRRMAEEYARSQEASRRQVEIERERQKLDGTPAGMVMRAYADYRLIQTCRQMRSGYSSVYLSEEQIERAREAASAAEKVALKLNPSLDVDAIWEQTGNEHPNGLTSPHLPGEIIIDRGNWNSHADSFCKRAFSRLIDQAAQALPQGQQHKKDF